MRTPRTRSWNDLTAVQKRGLTMLSIVQVALLVAALLDIRRRPATQIKGSKRAWAFASFINFIGPVAYFTFGRKR